QEPIPLAPDRLDVARRLRVIAQRDPDRANAALERRPADVGAAPGVAQEVLRWHHPARMQHQLMQHGQRLRLEGDPLPIQPELLVGGLAQEGPNPKVLPPRHGVLSQSDPNPTPSPPWAAGIPPVPPGLPTAGARSFLP